MRRLTRGTIREARNILTLTRARASGGGAGGVAIPQPTAQNEMLIADATPAWSLLAAPTAQYQVPIAGADPYIPAWAALTVEAVSDLAYATPALTLSTVNAEGSADTVVRSDATILAFDATVPNTIEPDDTAATGSASVAARCDHEHGIVCAAPASPSVSLAASAEGSGTSFARADHTHQLNQAIVPTWTGLHTFNAGITFGGVLAANTITAPDNATLAVRLVDAGNIEYLRIVSTDAQPVVVFNDGGADVDFRVEGSTIADLLCIDAGNDKVCVNSSSSDPNLAGHFQVIDGGSGISYQDDDAVFALFVYDNVAGDYLPAVAGRRARGTRASPTPVQAGDRLLRVGGGGYGATAFTVTSRGFMQVEATETWDDASQGARLMFFTTNNSETGPEERVRIDQDGSVLIGGTANRSSPLQISNDTAFSTASAEAGQSNVYLHNVTSGAGSGNFGPSIGFSGAGTARRVCSIVSVQTGADEDLVGLALFVHTSGVAADALTEAMRIDHKASVGIGLTTGIAGKTHIDQATSDAAIPVLVLDQADVSEGFINFVGSDRGVIAGETSSLKSVRVELSGVVYRLALYVDA